MTWQRPRKGRINTVNVWLTRPTECRYTYHPLHQNWMWIFLQLLHSGWNNVHLSNSEMRWLEMALVRSWGRVPASLLENLWDCRPQCPWASAYPGMGRMWTNLCWPVTSHGPVDRGKVCALIMLNLVNPCDWGNMIYFTYSLEVKNSSLLKIYYISQKESSLPTIIFCWLY